MDDTIQDGGVAAFVENINHMHAHRLNLEQLSRLSEAQRDMLHSAIVSERYDDLSDATYDARIKRFKLVGDLLTASSLSLQRNARALDALISHSRLEVS